MMYNDILLFSVQPVTVEGIKNFLSIEKHIRICGWAYDEAEIIKYLKQNYPQIILIDDTCLEKEKVIQFLKNLPKNSLTIKIIIYTIREDKEYFNSLFNIGVKGLLHKKSDKGKVLETIKKVSEGEFYVDSYWVTLFFGKNSNIKSNDKQQFQNLSKREKEILNFVQSGLQNKEIAKKLFLSVKTIEVHKENIKKKLGVCNSKDLMDLRFL